MHECQIALRQKEGNVIIDYYWILKIVMLAVYAGTRLQSQHSGGKGWQRQGEFCGSRAARSTP